MGYAQTFNYQPRSHAYAAWPTIVTDAQTIIETVGDRGITLRAGTSPGKPIAGMTTGTRFDDDASAKLSLDGFDLPAPHRIRDAPRDCRVRRFVTTQVLPYDLAVATVVPQTHLLAPQVFTIGGSGGWHDDWTYPPAANLRGLLARLLDMVIDDDPLTGTTEGMAIGPAGWVDPRLMENPVIP
jgi:hypothetical protein